jgi:quinol monooxygenase YgiN
MTEDVSWTFELTVSPQRLDEVKAFLETMVSSIESSEPETLNYEWSVDTAHTTIHVYERYRDSAAALSHLASFKAKFADRLFQMVKLVRVVVYGSPDTQLKSALASRNPVYMSPLAGFHR